MAAGARAASVLVSAAATGLLLGVCFAPEVRAQTCAYAAAPANLLTVNLGGPILAAMGRTGQQISVGQKLWFPVPCSGGVPTVFNTDTVRVLLRRRNGYVDLHLNRGPFAPGATPEAEGAAEIEIQYSGRDALATIFGTPGADEFHWGSGGAHAGLNLNPRSAGDRDVDVTIRGKLAFLVADGAQGDDRIIPSPGIAALDDRVYSVGGRGNDLLIAPRGGGKSVDETEGRVLDQRGKEGARAGRSYPRARHRRCPSVFVGR